MKIAKVYKIQFIIDVLVISMGILNYVLPNFLNLAPNTLFYIEMMFYSLFELLEYLFYPKRREPLFLALISSVACFSSYYLRYYESNMLLSIVIMLWTLMLIITKLINIEELPSQKRNLFLIILSSTILIALISIIVSLNLYISSISIFYMLGLLYGSFGIIELFSDFTKYVSIDGDFLKK